VWVFEISGSAPPAHFVGGWKGAEGFRQPPMYFPKGGSTLRDFVGSDGESGYFQLDYFVYDRAGLPCHVCGTPIRQIVQGQRSTYFCPRCQR